MKNDSDLLLSVFVAVEGAHAFSAFMPSYFTVKKFADSDGDIELLRSGYQPAIAFNLLLGALVSLMIKSPLPSIMSVVVILFMVTLYERAVV
jgi:hypothetical protein